MTIDWWTLGLQTINVVVLLWILQRFLFRPVAAVVAERQAQAAHVLDEAEAERARVAAEMQKASAEVARLTASRADTIAAAEAEAEAARKSILDAAKAEADRITGEARIAAEREKSAADAASIGHARTLALEIAAKLLDRLPPETRQTGFAEELATAVAALPLEERREIASAAPLRVAAARTPTKDEGETLRRRLAEALGSSVEVAFEIDPRLLAGYEIEAAHVVVRNSLRADLDRIAREFARDDDAR